MTNVAHFLLLAAGICLSANSVRAQFHLQIIHNNDLHARFVETDAYSASCPEEFVVQNKCFGGFARTKQAVDDAVQQAKRQNIPSIFLNAGDSFQGTPYYTIFKSQIVAQLIGTLGIDVMALGNHEFDDGIDNLVNYLTNIKIPVVCANLNMTSEKRLNLPILTPSKVLTVEGRKIGVIGYLTPDTMEISSPENLEIYPEIPYIRAEAQRLRADGVNIIIALGHSGFQMDVKIAEEVEEVSVVVGGHSHSLLYTPKYSPPSTESVTSEYPTMVRQKSGKVVPVVQAYAYSKYLGKLTVEFDDTGKVITATGNTQLLDYTVKKEPKLDKEISIWEKIVKERVSVVKGYTRTFLQKSDMAIGKFQSNLANLITDAFVDISIQYAKDRNEPTWTKSAIAIYQNGGIRTELDNKKNQGALTLEDLMTVLPFENKIVQAAYRGKTIKKAIEFSASSFNNEGVFERNYYLHFSGLRVAYDFSKPIGQRTKSIETLCVDCAVPKYEPLVDDRVYHVITVTFLTDGGDKFDMLKEELLNLTVLNTNDLDAVVHYVEKNKIVYPIEDNRVSVTGFKQHVDKQTSSASAVSSTTTTLYFMVFLPLLRILFF